MVPGYWQIASVLIFVIVGSSVVSTDKSCKPSDQFCLTSRNTDVLNRKTLDRGLATEEIRHKRLEQIEDSEKAERDTNQRREHQDKFFVQTSKDSRRLYDQIRNIKRTVADERITDKSDSKRLTDARRKVSEGSVTDSHLSKVENEDTEEVIRPETIRDRVVHRFGLPSEDRFDNARAQRRFSIYRDEVRNAGRLTTRFERLRNNRMSHLNEDNDNNDGTRIVSRFERIHKGVLARLNKGDIDLTSTETERLIPHHFRNLRKMRESLNRRESSFDRRNAYLAQVRNQVRISGESIKHERVEPRFEVQRKYREQLESELKLESGENRKDEKENSFMENRRMRKEERRGMEERLIREEKQRIYAEQQKVLQEARRMREREQRIRETEKKVKEIIKQIHEQERLAREQHKNANGEKSVQQQNLNRREDRQRNNDHEVRHQTDKNRVNVQDGRNTYDEEKRVFDLEQRVKTEKTKGNSNGNEEQNYDEPKLIFDDESNWDYSDSNSEYSDSDESDSYEDESLEEGNERRIREDIRLFPDIRRQIRENVQMYGREYLDAREVSSSEENLGDDRTNTEPEKNKFRDEKRIVDGKANRRKRSISEQHGRRPIHTERSFRQTERARVIERRQIAERNSFRSQDERLIRKVNLRRMNDREQMDLNSNRQNRRLLKEEALISRLTNEQREVIDLEQDKRSNKQRNEREQEHSRVIKGVIGERRELISETKFGNFLLNLHQNDHVRAISVTHFFQAALIGFILLKATMKQEFSNKKFGCNYLANKIPLIF